MNILILQMDSSEAICREFPGDLRVKGSIVVTAVAQVQSLAWEIPHAKKPTKKPKVFAT